MKKRSIITLTVGLLLLLSAVVGWFVTSRNAQRQWPSEQLQNAITLSAALSTYQQNHGSFPARLEDLVAGGTLGDEAFQRLQFRAGPRAQPEHWLYKTPEKISDIAIVSPTAIVPWEGHSGYTVTARADGGGELISGTKHNRVPTWATK